MLRGALERGALRFRLCVDYTGGSFEFTFLYPKTERCSSATEILSDRACKKATSDKPISWQDAVLEKIVRRGVENERHKCADGGKGRDTPDSFLIQVVAFDGRQVGSSLYITSETRLMAGSASSCHDPRALP